MALSDIKVRNAKPSEKTQKLFDGNGLFLAITPQGGKSWRLKYRFEGKEKLLTFGAYPGVSLSAARVKGDEARQLLAHGIDPGAVKKAQKEAKADQAANSFEVVAREWHTKHKHLWKEAHACINLRKIEIDIFPWLGSRPVAEITPPELLTALRRIESRGALDTAHRVRSICGQVFRYAIATGRAERDPSADLKGAIPPAGDDKHHAAITDPLELAGLLRAIHGYNGSFIVKSAMVFGALTAVRPGELRCTEWSEIDFESATWNIPAEKIKTKVPHVVPLSRQALAILKEIQPLTGESRYVFPNGRSYAKPMSSNGARMALIAMDYGDRHTGHGWRATFRTILDEVLGERVDLIEHQLAHAVKDPNGRAYNRTSHLEERRRIMQTWADYLDGLRQGAKVIPIRRAA